MADSEESQTASTSTAKAVDPTRSDAAQSELWTIVETALEGIVRIDANGQIEFSNGAFSGMVGSSREELAGTRLLDLFEDEYSGIMTAIAAPTPTKHILRRRDGSTLQCVMTHTPLSDAKGDFAGAIVVILDNSVAHQLEQLVATSTKLETAGRIAYSVTHEISTAVQFVGNNAEFLLSAVETLLEQTPDPDEFLAEEIPRALREMIVGTTQLARVISAMRSFGRPGEARRTTVDLANCLEDSLVITRYEYKDRVDVAVDIEPGLEVKAIAGALNQVFVNLIVNALHAVKDRYAESRDGQLIVKLVRDGDSAIASIQDNGTGIPEEVREKVFNPFFTTKSTITGSGQGLAVIRSIVERHGGSIWFETETNRGTTFFVRLPVVSLPSPSK